MRRVRLDVVRVVEVVGVDVAVAAVRMGEVGVMLVGVGRVVVVVV